MTTSGSTAHGLAVTEEGEGQGEGRVFARQEGLGRIPHG